HPREDDRGDRGRRPGGEHAARRRRPGARAGARLPGGRQRVRIGRGRTGAGRTSGARARAGGGGIRDPARGVRRRDRGAAHGRAVHGRPRGPGGALRVSERAVPRGLPAACAGAGMALFAIGALDCLNFAVDDSFISLRFAENWARGLGLVFNPGERVEGFSNLLWTLMLGGLARLGIDQQRGPYALLMAAKLLGAAFALLALLVLALHILTSTRDATAGPGHAPLATLAGAGAGGTSSLARWSLSGMETGLATFLVTLAGVLMLRLLRRHDAGRPPPALAALGPGLAFGVLSLVRPEQVVVWGVTMLVLFAASPAPVRRSLAVSALPTLALFLAASAWRFGYYGQPVPNSVVAKAGGGVGYLLLGAKYALASLAGTVGVLALSAFALPAVARAGHEGRFLVAYCASYV